MPTISINNIPFKWCLYFLCAIFIISLPIAQEKFNSFFRQQESVIYAGLYLCLLCGIVLSYSLWGVKKRVFIVTIPDIMVSLYLVYGLFNLYVIKGSDLDPFILYKWTAIGLGYLIFRMLPDKHVVLYFLVISGCIQAMICIGQYLDLLDSNHSFFRITGSFKNPGQCGGYLAVTFISAICLAIVFFKKRRNIPGYTLCVAAILNGCGMIICDSRAAILGVLGGGLLLLYDCFRKFSDKYKRYILPMMVLVILFSTSILYMRRPESADARLLTWRVSWEMIKDKPLTGHGISSFQEKYMLYQAEYFKSHPVSKYILVADNTVFPFNEVLHIGIEQGVIGFFLVGMLFLAAFIKTDRTQIYLKIPLVTLSVFSLFSYPGSIFPLVFLFPLLIGSLRSKKIAEIPVSRRHLYFIIYPLFVSLFMVYLNQGIFYRQAKKTISSSIALDSGNLKRFITTHNEMLLNPYVNSMYLQWILNKKRYEEVLSGTYIHNFPSYGAYCTLGDIYMNAGHYKEAEYYYSIASYMIPNRIKPNFYLWKLYLKTNDQKAAIKIARKIITQPVKVEGTFTLKARAEVRNFLRDRTP